MLSSTPFSTRLLATILLVLHLPPASLYLFSSAFQCEDVARYWMLIIAKSRIACESLKGGNVSEMQRPWGFLYYAAPFQLHQ